MPDIEAGQDLLDRLSAIGWHRKSGDGLTGVSYQEIQSWCILTGERLTAWEVDTLRLLSSIYANELMRSTRDDYTCPIEMDEEVAERNKRLDALFR